jgi:hypothetical protein
MSGKTAALAVKRYFHFDTAIPCHYGTFDLLAPDPSAFVAAMQGHSTKVTVPRIGEVLAFWPPRLPLPPHGQNEMGEMRKRHDCISKFDPLSNLAHEPTFAAPSPAAHRPPCTSFQTPQD